MMSYETKPLSQIARVRTAVVLRDAPLMEVEDGNVFALTIRDILATHPIDVLTLARVQVPDDIVRHCLATGDIAIPSRGDYYTARFFGGPAGKVLPIGQINVVSPGLSISGPYLAWFLNQEASQRYVASRLTGTSIKALGKRALLEMPILVPPLEIQKRIAQAQTVWEDLKATRARLTEVEERQLNETCRALLEAKQAT